jgi:predicted RNA-binding Zn ribbon-like protein
VDEPSRAATVIRDFANTVDLGEETDELATPGELAAWLAAAGLVEAGSTIDRQGHQTYLELRSGIREALAGHAQPATGRVGEADAVLARLPVLVNLSPVADRVLLPSPDLPPARQGLATLALAWARIVLTGEAARLKRCAEDTCGWVFWDVSKNRSRRWCSMRVCGNRAKARTYAAKQRELRA